jgi:hypothetical protein
MTLTKTFACILGMAAASCGGHKQTQPNGGGDGRFQGIPTRLTVLEGEGLPYLELSRPNGWLTCGPPDVPVPHSTVAQLVGIPPGAIRFVTGGKAAHAVFLPRCDSVWLAIFQSDTGQTCQLPTRPGDGSLLVVVDDRCAVLGDRYQTRGGLAVTDAPWAVTPSHGLGVVVSVSAGSTTLDFSLQQIVNDQHGHLTLTFACSDEGAMTGSNVCDAVASFVTFDFGRAGLFPFPKGTVNLPLTGANLPFEVNFFTTGTPNLIGSGAGEIDYVPAAAAIRATGEHITGDFQVVVGDSNTVVGLHNTVIGDNNTIKGHANAIYGDSNSVTGDGNRIYGDNDIANGTFNQAFGNEDSVAETGAKDTSSWSPDWPVFPDTPVVSVSGSPALTAIAFGGFQFADDEVRLGFEACLPVYGSAVDSAVWNLPGVSLTSSDPTVLTVTHAGCVTGQSVGIATVTATVGGFTATDDVVVEDGPL